MLFIPSAVKSVFWIAAGQGNMGELLKLYLPKHGPCVTDFMRLGYKIGMFEMNSLVT
jgi:hypothetical protein